MAVRRPLWRIRFRHWCAEHGVDLLRFAAEMILGVIAIGATFLCLILLLALGV